MVLRLAGNVRKSRGRRIGTIQKIKNKKYINIIRLDVESSVSVDGVYNSHSAAAVLQVSYIYRTVVKGRQFEICRRKNCVLKT